MKRITKIEAAKENDKRKLRVAAYARVSTDSEEQLLSLDTQKNRYETYIKERPDWEFVGLYYDEGITGTKLAKRDGLLKLISDCERGVIDYIIIKSISRFSRNTVDSIEIVRKLCSMGIYIYFEKENIDTGKMESELLLSILSSLAESESHSIAENNKWSIQKRFQSGTFKISYWFHSQRCSRYVRVLKCFRESMNLMGRLKRTWSEDNRYYSSLPKGFLIRQCTLRLSSSRG